MKKLSTSDIDSILKEKTSGSSVALIATKYSVQKATIYYHLHKYTVLAYIEKPTCYKDFLKNKIFRLEKEIHSGLVSAKILPFKIAELKLTRESLNINLNDFVDNDIGDIKGTRHYDNYQL